jgi:hypothetical protein
MGVQVPRRLHAEVPQEGLFGQIGRHRDSVFHELAHQAAEFFGSQILGEQLQLKLASS